MGKKIGIDLGTTYSCVAYLNDLGGLEATKNDANDSTTPSIVFFDPNEDIVIVGKEARAQSAIAPENIVERIKSQMESKDYTIRIKDVDYSPAAISSIILKKLKADAEEYLNDEIDGCVITCPAYFGTIGRNATKMAAENAGLNVYSIINEPTAAAFAYAYQKKEDVNKNVLIYDLGGGTFDCTLLNMDFAGDAKHLNVIASNGDAFLGGKDWDAVLRDYVIEEFCRNSGEDEDALKNDIECMVDLSERVENAKKLLTKKESTKILVAYNGSKENIEITRDKFEEITEHLLNKTIMLVNNMLQNNGKSPDDFEEIILVGGSTYMPQVEKRLGAEYGKPMAKFEPNEAVAKGAALMAANSYSVDEGSADPYNDIGYPGDSGDSDFGGAFVVKGTDGKDIIVDDIINKSYGVSILDNGVVKILNILINGTSKPCSGSNEDVGLPLTVGRATEITICETDEKETLIDYDEAFDVYRGPLNLPNGLPEDTPVKVFLDLDVSGVLNIRVVAGENGEYVTNLVFDPSTGGASTAGLDNAQKYSLG